MPPSRRVRCSWGLAGLLTAMALAACGGGSSPTAPEPPAPPPAAGVAVEGAVEGFFAPGTGFAGTRVELQPAGSGLSAAAAATTQVDAGNGYRLSDVAPGDYLAIFRGSGHLERRVSVRVRAGGANRLAAIDLVESDGFRLAAFDEIYRSRGLGFGNIDGGTVRWTAAPTLRLVGEHFDALGGPGAVLRGRIEDFVRGPLGGLTQGVLAGAAIRETPPRQISGRLCAAGSGVEDLEVIVDAVDRLTGPGGEPLTGSASVCPVSDNVLVRGILTLAKSASEVVVAHEFAHLLGAQHLHDAAGSSIMRVPVRVSGFTAMDLKHLEYLYRRPPGTRSPDDTSHLETLSGELLAASETAALAGDRALPADLRWPPETGPAPGRETGERGLSRRPIE